MGQAISQARLEDRYYLQKVKLGQGSFGTVWRAVDRQSNNVVAIKQLDKAAMPRRGVRPHDIEREINVMQTVSHDNITRLLSTFEDRQNIYLALEYCDGGDFGDKVKEKGLVLQEHEAAEWMRQIVSAIVALHSKSICHRDIKPDNFMVHGERLKLADFGLALFLPRGRLLTEKCGTPAFMSPEQHRLPRQSRGYTNSCDVWAAGVTMYMLMFGGRHPFLNGTQQLDEKRLLQGLLDFSVAQGFFGFGMGESRYSEGARRLCRRLTEPDVAKRVSAEDARQDPWLNMGGRRASGDVAPLGPKAVGGAPTAQPDLRRAKTTPLDNAAAVGVDAGAQSWWPFGGTDENARPNGQPQEPTAKGAAETEAELHKRIEALEEQVRLQQEQNESQWEALVHGNKVMQQLVQEKQKLADWQGRRGTAVAAGPEDWKLAKQNAGLGAGKAAEAKTGGGQAAAVGDPVPRGFLQVGTKCRYNSASWSGWMPAVVQSYNEKDGTYNLDVKMHAKLENISPAPDVKAVEAWPPGTLVHYESSTVKHWLPAVVRSFNENTGSGEGTYNLDVRECAQVDRMRPRLA